MSLRVGEIGKLIRVNCDYDLTSNTQLSLVFTKPGGTSVTKTKADGITAPSTAATDPDTGDIYAANEYMEYAVESGLLDEDGIWTVYAKYEDATPKTFIGDSVTFSVLPVA